uniref:cyclic GMP-AMP synthase n=1 Tax=Semicossyphus pulcher TaxID=241346 RepID=UPI0037E89103
MTGRGRPRKAKSPDKTRQEDKKVVSLPRCPGKDFSEEKQNGTPKEQKPKERKKINQSEENPPKETTKHQRAPVDNTKASARGTRPKTTRQSADGITKTQPKTPTDTTKDLMKAEKAKPSVRKAKSPQEFIEVSDVQPETPKDTTKDLIKAEKAKPKGRVPQKKREDKTSEDSILSTTLEKLKIKRQEKSDASKVVNNLIDHIIAHMKQNTLCFKEVQEPLRTGSYYENLKISNPDEFDVMLPIRVDRVDVQPFGDDGAFYSVALKRGKSPLQKFQETSILSASEMLKDFRDEVKKCAKKFPEWKMDKKKKGCPAVTLTTTVQSVTISLDVVLSLVVKSSWPSFTREGLKVEGWLGRKVKQEYKWLPYYLVPKYEGKGTVVKDDVPAKDVWRVSFSHVEKAILKNHGSEKTCCEKDGVRCCRKECLKLLKHLLGLLKEKNSSLDKFCSYHAKTTLLHACCSRTKDSDWRASDLSSCFRMLLNDFVEHLERGSLQNFFIPSQNLLSGPGKKKCSDLARCIREECDNGFLIFNDKHQ